MASPSGIRASGSGPLEYLKKILMKDASSYGPRRTKLTVVLDAEDCLEIVNGTEMEPPEIAEVQDAENIRVNITEVEKRHLEIRIGERGPRRPRLSSLRLWMTALS